MNRSLTFGLLAILALIGLSLFTAGDSLAGHCGHRGGHGCHGGGYGGHGCHGGGYGCHGGYSGHGCHGGGHGCHGGHYQGSGCSGHHHGGYHQEGVYEDMPDNNRDADRFDSSPSGEVPPPASSRNYQRKAFGFRNVSFRR